MNLSALPRWLGRSEKLFLAIAALWLISVAFFPTHLVRVALQGAMLGVGGRNLSLWSLLAQAGVWCIVSHRVSAAVPLPAWSLLLMLAASALAATLLLATAARVVERKELSAR